MVICSGKRVPTVAYFADKCCYSTKYFGELVKTETGRTAKSMINDRLLSASRLAFRQLHRHLLPSEEFSRCNITGAKVRKYFYIYLVRTMYAY